MGWEIRAARESDLPEMLKLWREMMDFHARCDERFRPRTAPEAEQAWTRYLRKSIWPSDKWCVFVAEGVNGLAGQIAGELRDVAPVFEPQTYGYVTDIVVDPAARRWGVGQALFAALRDWMRERGADHLRLQVLDRNPASQAFWREMGCSDFSDVMWYDFQGDD